MLKNVVALVTGAVYGLGNATAMQLLLQNATVIGCDIRPDTAEEQNKGKPNYQFLQADVRSEEDITRVINHIKEKQGRLDVVVNCAGIGGAFRTFRFLDFQPRDLEDVTRVLDVNVVGSFNVSRLATLLMKENKPDSDGHRGVIINTSGFMSTEGRTAGAILAASYGAIDSMTKPMAKDLECLGIRAVTISPGLFQTALTSSFDDKTKKFFESLCVFPHRLGFSDEYGSLVLQVIQNKMINGEVIRIDGGLRLPIFL